MQAWSWGTYIALCSHVCTWTYLGMTYTEFIGALEDRSRERVREKTPPVSEGPPTPGAEEASREGVGVPNTQT